MFPGLELDIRDPASSFDLRNVKELDYRSHERKIHDWDEIVTIHIYVYKTQFIKSCCLSKMLPEIFIFIKINTLFLPLSGAHYSGFREDNSVLFCQSECFESCSICIEVEGLTPIVKKRASSPFFLSNNLNSVFRIQFKQMV